MLSSKHGHGAKITFGCPGQRLLRDHFGCRNKYHFGWMDWSPPGLPGGGMTGIGPPGGVGCLISGSTCSGGQITPPERASLSLRFRVASRCWGSTSLPFPVVLGVSECAHFGSSCSVLGATGALVGGGA